jgi:hypothetical protein
MKKFDASLQSLFESLSAKRLCFQLAGINSLSGPNEQSKIQQMVSEFNRSNPGQEFSETIIQRFNWQNVFDVMRLHFIFAEFFSS